MSAIRIPAPPAGYVRPAELPRFTLAQLAGRRLPSCECGGTLWVTPPTWDPGHVACLLCERVVAEVVDSLPEIVDWADEQNRPKRGRPPGRPSHSARIRAAASTVPPRACVDCGTPCHGVRCRSCLNANLARWPRLVAFLADGLPHHASEIREALGISHDSLRQFVHNARREGYPIRSGTPFGHYRLETSDGR